MEELAVVFEAMVLQSDAGRLCKYLGVFGRRALPVFDSRLLRYAEHESSDVRRSANRALSHYSHPEVRRLAIERVSDGRFLEDELRLLMKNYQPGDAAILERAIHAPEDRDHLHGLIFDLVQLFEANPVVEAAQPMHFVYEESPCSNCRCNAVKVLIATDSAPEWLLEESRYDSSEETRSIAAEASS